MRLDIQFKLKSNPLYIKYLHENSYWYKLLNRDPNKIEEFINEVKTNYKLRTSDKIENVLSTLDMLSTIMSTLK